MEILFSKTTGGFYQAKTHGDGVPQDSKPVPLDRYKSLLKEQALGKLIVGDESGFPIAVEQAAPTVEELLFAAKNELRSMRAPMLDALTGIAGRAVRAGNDSLAAEADALAELLLGITDDAELNSATTQEEMRAAGVAAYKRIAAATGPALSIVFKKVTGA